MKNESKYKKAAKRVLTELLFILIRNFLYEKNYSTRAGRLSRGNGLAV